MSMCHNLCLTVHKTKFSLLDKTNDPLEPKKFGLVINGNCLKAAEKCPPKLLQMTKGFAGIHRQDIPCRCGTL